MKVRLLKRVRRDFSIVRVDETKLVGTNDYEYGEKYGFPFYKVQEYSGSVMIATRFIKKRKAMDHIVLRAKKIYQYKKGMRNRKQEEKIWWQKK